MAEPRGAWAIPRPSASHTPQSKSSNASPNPASSAAPAIPAGNVWAARAAQRVTPAVSPAAGKKEESESGPTVAAGAVQDKHVPVNGFNYFEVKQFLGRGEKGSVYKADKSGGTSSGKAANMANGQSFFAHLSKQIASLQAK